MAMKNISDEQVCSAYYQCQLQKSMVMDAPMDLYPYHFLMEWTGECEKVCFRAMERACDRGYIEYGVSLRCGWLTEKGMELITINNKEL